VRWRGGGSVLFLQGLEIAPIRKEKEEKKRRPPNQERTYPCIGTGERSFSLVRGGGRGERPWRSTQRGKYLLAHHHLGYGVRLWRKRKEKTPRFFLSLAGKEKKKKKRRSEIPCYTGVAEEKKGKEKPAFLLRFSEKEGNLGEKRGTSLTP